MNDYTPNNLTEDQRALLATYRETLDQNRKMLLAIKEIGIIAFDAMENCDEPHFSRYVKIVDLCEKAVK